MGGRQTYEWMPWYTDSPTRESRTRPRAVDAAIADRADRARRARSTARPAGSSAGCGRRARRRRISDVAIKAAAANPATANNVTGRGQYATQSRRRREPTSACCHAGGYRAPKRGWRAAASAGARVEAGRRADEIALRTRMKRRCPLIRVKILCATARVNCRNCRRAVGQMILLAAPIQAAKMKRGVMSFDLGHMTLRHPPELASRPAAATRAGRRRKEWS